MFNELGLKFCMVESDDIKISIMELASKNNKTQENYGELENTDDFL